MQQIMTSSHLSGMGVALITPFKKDKSIDYNALERMLAHVESGGCDYIVVLGTTAETPALFPEEKKEVRKFIVDKTGGRIPLILGFGGNNTSALVQELSSEDLSDFEAILSVVPFYNKPTQEGIYRHFRAIDEASPVPVVLYNVPGRTGVNMTAETTLRLAHDCRHVIGIKEASGKMEQCDTIIRNKPTDFQLVSGDDSLTYPLMTMGAVGVISVIGNAFPKEFGALVKLCSEGHFPEALDIHYKFDELCRLLFVDGNPAGVKCLLNAMGLIENELRLPLVATRLDTNEKIHRILSSLTS